MGPQLHEGVSTIAFLACDSALRGSWLPKVWAETMFAMSPTMVFMPAIALTVLLFLSMHSVSLCTDEESCFCAELVADWEKCGTKIARHYIVVW